MSDDRGEEERHTEHERLEGFNRRFYAGDPAAYFRLRIVGVRALLPRDGVLSEVARELMAVARLDQVELAKHIAIDTQVLLHHVAEAVLRFFMSHRDEPACPWLELAGETNFVTFKRSVTEWRRGVRRIDRQVAWVFLGSTEAPSGVEEASWERAAENATMFVRKLADLWLDENHIYNSLKHGLAATAGDSALQLGEEGKPLVRLADGMSIEYLETEPWVDDRRSWHLTTVWIDSNEALDLAGAGCRLLESAWKLAQWRYLDDSEEAQVEVWLPEISPTELIRPRGVRRFSMKMLGELRARQ